MMAELRLLDALPIEEEVVGIEGFIAMGIIGRAVGVVGAAFGDELNLSGGRAAAGIGVVAGGGGGNSARASPGTRKTLVKA